MANKTIKGLTVEIGGDTTQLQKALDSVENKSRNLSAELGQINKLLKMDPGNAELLAQKQKVLAEAVANTAKKLETLKEAEKQVQQQFERGDVSEDQVRALQREIIETEKKMGGYEKAAKETADEIKNLGKHTEDAEKKTSKFGNTVKAVGSVAVKGIAAAGAAALAAAGSLAKMATSAAAYADEILTTSTVTGISTQKLQEYTYAAELVDVSVETLTKSHAKQIKSMKAVQDGTKLMVDAYDTLGVAVMNADGSLRDGETVYWEVIDALGKMENETERDALAMQILGKSAQELNPLIEAGSERMAELAQEAQEVGAVMSDETLGALGAFDDSIQRFKGSAAAAGKALGTVFLPELTALTTGGARMLAEFTDKLQDTGGGLEGFAVVVDDMADEIGDKAGELLTGIVEKGTELLPTIINTGIKLITSVGTSIIQKLPTLIPPIVKTIVGCAPQLLNAALTLFKELVKAIPPTATALAKELPKLWSTIWSYMKTLPSQLASIGGELVKGLWQGITNKNGWLRSMIRGWVGNVTSFLKNLFGIHSPSKVTAYMGEMLDEGLAVGIEDNTDAPKKALSDLTTDLVEEAGHVDGLTIDRQVTHAYSVSAAETAAQNAGLLGKLDKILAAIERGQVLTINGDLLVGATANSMNNALGQRRILAERGAL